MSPGRISRIAPLLVAATALAADATPAGAEEATVLEAGAFERRSDTGALVATPD